MTDRDTSVLITGIRGFVGTNLMRYLHDNGKYAITGSSRNILRLQEVENELYQVLDNESVIQKEYRFDAYIHLAGKVYDIEEIASPGEYFKANFDFAKYLFDHFIEDNRAKKFIFLSTIHVLTENPERVLDESYPPHPVTPYGESKLQAERYMLQNCPADKQLYILRPSMIHGPGNKGSLNLLYGLIKSGLPYPIGAVNNRRSFVSIENLCFIIHEILQQEIESGLYHVADNEPTYTHNLVEMIADSLGEKTRIWPIPLPMLKVAARIGNVSPFPLNEHRLNKLTGDFIVSNRKILEAIGKPLPVTSEEGLRRTIHSFRS